MLFWILFLNDLDLKLEVYGTRVIDILIFKFIWKTRNGLIVRFNRILRGYEA